MGNEASVEMFGRDGRSLYQQRSKDQAVAAMPPNCTCRILASPDRFGDAQMAHDPKCAVHRAQNDRQFSE